MQLLVVAESDIAGSSPMSTAGPMQQLQRKIADGMPRIWELEFCFVFWPQCQCRFVLHLRVSCPLDAAYT